MDLSTLSQSLSDLPSNPLFNLGLGIMQASGPSLMPHSLGQSLAQGSEYASQAQQRAAQARMIQLQAQQMGLYNNLLQNAASGTQGQAQLDPQSQTAGDAPQLASANGTPGQSFSAGVSSGAPQTAGQQMMHDPMSIMGMIKDPSGFFNAYYNRNYPQPTDFVKTLQAAGIDPNSQMGRQLIQQNIAKQNYQAPTSLRPGGWMLDPVTQKLTQLPTAPSGFQVVQDPTTGQFSTVPVANGVQALADSEAAKAQGQAQEKIQKVWNPETGQYENQTVANVAAAANGATPPLRNNNPGALMPGGQLASYPDMATGLKALDENLSSYGQQGINTIRDAIYKWAPPKDAKGNTINNTDAYVSDVAQRLGISPTQQIDLSNPAQRQALSTAIMLHENGPSALFGNAPAKSGAMAAEPQLGAPQAAISAKTATPESMQKDYEAMLAQGPQSQQALDALDKMVSLAQNKPWYLGGPVGIVPGVDRMSSDAAEYEKQRANVIALMGKSLGSGGTDASRANIAESIPDYGKPKTAMLDGLQTQRNQVATGMLRRQLLTPAYNSGDANKYTALSNGFDQNIKPSMAPILQMGGKDQAAAVAKAIQEHPELKPNFQWALDNGLLK